MADHIEPKRFFEKSNQSGKSWSYKHLGGGKFQITKVGAKCEVCTQKFGGDKFKSVRVQYASFLDKQGKKKEEFEWINVRCECAVFIIYKSGHTSITPSPWYAERMKIFDDIGKLPSDIHLRVND